MGSRRDRLGKNVQRPAQLLNIFSPNVINFMDDTNLRPGDECEEPLPCTWHTRIENIVYHSRDWASPGTVPEFLLMPHESCGGIYD